MRRIMAVLLTGTMALCAGGCASSSREAYEFAERCFGLGEYETAVEYFMQLGEYRDSAEYLLYAEALLALEKGDLALAKANLAMIAPFKSAERYLRCIGGLELEKAGEYEAALEVFRQLGTFAGCDKRAERLVGSIPEREKEACRELMKKGDHKTALEKLKKMEKSTETARLLAECAAAMQKMAYRAACTLYEEGKMQEAMAAFAALGDVMDAPEKLEVCRSELYKSTVEAAVTLETLPQLMETYAALGDYRDSAERLAEMQSRSRCNTSVCTGDLIRIGKDETGAAVTWQVEKVLEDVAWAACEMRGEAAWSAEEMDALAEVSYSAADVRPMAAVHKRNDKPFRAITPDADPDIRRAVALIDLTGAPLTDGDGSETAPYRIDK